MAMIQRDNYTRRFKRNSNHITFTNQPKESKPEKEAKIKLDWKWK